TRIARGVRRPSQRDSDTGVMRRLSTSVRYLTHRADKRYPQVVDGALCLMAVNQRIGTFEKVKQCRVTGPQETLCVSGGVACRLAFAESTTSDTGGQPEIDRASCGVLHLSKRAIVEHHR